MGQKLGEVNGVFALLIKIAAIMFPPVTVFLGFCGYQLMSLNRETATLRAEIVTKANELDLWKAINELKQNDVLISNKIPTWVENKILGLEKISADVLDTQHRMELILADHGNKLDTLIKKNP